LIFSLGSGAFIWLPHVLALNIRRLAHDWEHSFNQAFVAFGNFLWILPDFKGTSYKAANLEVHRAIPKVTAKKDRAMSTTGP